VEGAVQNVFVEIGWQGPSVGKDTMGTYAADVFSFILRQSGSRFQRALADFGYGQIKPSGVVDAETKSAIEKFERERKLPPTGQPSDRVMREMTDMTGRQLD